MVICGVIASLAFYLLLIIGVYYKEKVVIKIFDSIKVIVYALIFTCLTFVLSLFYALLSIVLSESIFGGLTCAVFLVLSWWIVEKLYEILYDGKRGGLSENEKNVCNLFAMLGMISSSVYLLLQQNDNNYVILVSTAVAILIGAYVPISEIYQEKSFKDVTDKVLSNFRDVRCRVVITGFVCVCIMTFLVSSNDTVQRIKELLDEVGKGIVYGTIAFIIILFILAKTKVLSTKKDK